MKDVDTRDRWIMLGLVVLGFGTLIAGVLSGRSTIDYVLSRDAREAATIWTQEIETHLRTQGASAPVRSESIQVVDSAALQDAIDHKREAVALPEKAGAGKDGFGFVDVINRMTHGWLLSYSDGDGDFVSQRDGFAVVSPSGKALAVSGDLSAGNLPRILANPDVETAFATAVRDNAVELASLPSSDEDLRVAMVPVTHQGKVTHVLAYLVNQTAAASLTNVALAVVTVTTSLLIVMGFSVPALVASHRIRERWHAEDRIHFLALHDSLTGLPNRLQFHQHLDRSVARAKRHDSKLAVFALDLDRFKNVNDTLGHSTGDALLEEVAARLKETVRESDLVGRLGGDEFAVVAEEVGSPEDVMKLARRICEALAAGYHVNGHDVTTSASVGIALGPIAGEPADTLLKNADLALYRAKEEGRSTFRFFEPAMDAALQKRRKLEHDLRSALQKNQLYLDYQPQFGLENGKLTGYEALVRWWHPSEGEIPPSTFVPIAEETGLIVPLGEWILKTACSYATTWPLDTKLAVNLSPAQFKTQDVYSLVKRVLAETGLEPERLEVEITEGTILQNTETVIATLTKLDELGVSVAMDDFGTGYSSLSYLTRFPVKKIKIDRSFIDTLGSSDQTSAIVSSIVGLGQSLHVTITAEGVENENQAAMLREWGCDQVQGYYYGRPEVEVAESNIGETPLDISPLSPNALDDTVSSDAPDLGPMSGDISTPLDIPPLGEHIFDDTMGDDNLGDEILRKDGLSEEADDRSAEKLRRPLVA